MYVCVCLCVWFMPRQLFRMNFDVYIYIYTYPLYTIYTQIFLLDKPIFKNIHVFFSIPDQKLTNETQVLRYSIPPRGRLNMSRFFSTLEQIVNFVIVFQVISSSIKHIFKQFKKYYIIYFSYDVRISHQIIYYIL